MTNILIVGYKHIATFDMTTIAFERYSKYLPIVVHSKFSKDVSSYDLKWCDIFMCIRGDDPLSAYLCRIAKKHAKRVLLLIDDDLLEYELYKQPLYDRMRKIALKSVLTHADILLTPSEYLGNKLCKQFNIPYVVTNTVVDSEDIKTRRDSSDNIRIVYACSHNAHFNKLVKPMLHKLSARYGEFISFTIIGPSVDLSDTGLSVTHVDSMPLQKYREYMNTHTFDIGLAPLEDTEMTRSKYFNKYIEYTNNQIVGIYSNNLPYTLVVKDGFNGLLADNTPEAWYLKTCEIIDNKELRAVCLDNASKHIKETLSLSQILSELVRDMPDIISYRAAETHIPVLFSSLIFHLIEFISKVDYRIARMF